MSIQIKLKNSVVQDSTPSTSDLPAVGEIALNANINSIGGFMRASDNSIVKIFGPGSLSTPTATTTVSGISELATNAETTTGSATNRVVTPAGLNAVTVAERTTSNNNYVAKAGSTLTGVLTMPNGSNSAPAINFGDSDSGIFGGTNTVSLAAGGTTRLTADTGVSVVGTLAVTGSITSTGNLDISQKLIHAGDTDTFLEFLTDTICFDTGGSEAARIDLSQRLLVGISSARGIASRFPSFQVEGGNNSRSSLSVMRNSADNAGSSLILGKSRGTSNLSNTIVNDDDQIGVIRFCAADGTDTNSQAAAIAVFIDGTPGSNDVPGRLLFSTTADGAAVPTTRLTIDSAGLATFANAVSVAGNLTVDTNTFHVDSSNNRIGVGTTSPSGTISLNSNNPNIRFDDSDTNNSGEITLDNTQLRIECDEGNAVGSSQIKLRVDGADVAVFDGSGNMGLGTSNVTNGTLSILANNPNIRLDDSDTSNSGEITLDNTQLRIECDEDNAVGASAISFRLDGSERVSIDANGLNINQKLVHEGDTDTFLEFLTDTMCFDTAGSERMRITSGGNVGIGTINPQTHLTLRAANPQFTLEPTANTQTCRLQFCTSDGTIKTTIQGGGSLDTALRVVQNSGEVLRLNTSGHVGIGTTLPASICHLQDSGTNIEFFRAEADLGTNNNRSIRIVGPASDSATAPFRLVTGNAIAFEIDAVQKMILDETGQLGIGADPDSILHISSGTSGDCELIIEADTDNSNENDNPRILFRQDGGSDQSSVGIGNNLLELRNGVSSGGGIRFMTTSTTGYANAEERMRVLTGGNVSIGSTLSKARLYIRGSGNGSGAFAIDIENSDNTELFKIRNDGYFATGVDGGSPINFTGGSANVHINSNGRLMTVSSSKKYKEDITNALWGLAEVLKLRPVTFKYKTQSKENKKYAGFTAEELHDLGLKDFVDYKNNQPDSINYPNMVALMAKAIQELNAKVTKLEAA